MNAIDQVLAEHRQKLAAKELDEQKQREVCLQTIVQAALDDSLGDKALGLLRDAIGSLISAQEVEEKLALARQMIGLAEEVSKEAYLQERATKLRAEFVEFKNSTQEKMRSLAQVAGEAEQDARRASDAHSQLTLINREHPAFTKLLMEERQKRATATVADTKTTRKQTS